jgi:hypothetical protein
MRQTQLKTTRPKKPKKCKVKICGRDFVPDKFGQIVCSPRCAVELAYQKRKADKIKQDAAFRKETRRRKLALLDNDPKHWAQKAQRQFNKWIRIRDKNSPCISCRTLVGGIVEHWSGGAFQAGHYRPAGNHSALRFDETNCHAQCVQCNMHKSANLTMYRKHLIKKIGLERVEWLDNHNGAKRWTVPELKEIFYTYQTKVIEHDDN